MKHAALLVVVALTGLLIWTHGNGPDASEAPAHPVAAPEQGATAPQQPVTRDDAPISVRSTAVADAPKPAAATTDAPHGVTTTETPPAAPTSIARLVERAPAVAKATPRHRPAEVLDPATLPENYTLTAEANPTPAPPPPPAATTHVDDGLDTAGGPPTLAPTEDITFDGVRPEDEDITFDGVRDVTFDGIRPEVAPPPVLVLGPPTPGAAWDGAGLSPTEADTFEPPDYTNSIAANPPEPPADLETATLAEPPPVWDGEGTDTSQD